MSVTFKQFLSEEPQSENLQNFAKFICTLFAARDTAHTLHLSTSSFAEHSALNELYELLLAHIDELAEMLQGKYGKLPIATSPEVIPGENAKVFMNYLVGWAEGTGLELLGDNQVIISKYEELVGELYKIKYKIDNLS
jgi:hypothetical protein